MISAITPAWAGSDEFIEAGPEIALAGQADDLFGELAVLEEEKRGDGADAVFGGEGLVLIDVNLADARATGIFVGEFVEDGSDHFAGAAPFSPEINQDWAGGFQDFLLKVIGGEGDDIGGCHCKSKLNGKTDEKPGPLFGSVINKKGQLNRSANGDVTPDSDSDAKGF